MAVVIRPTLDVFRRQTPLLVIFGAGGGPGIEDHASNAEDAALGQIVAEARRFRVDLAFCRFAPDREADAQIVWKDDCRPTIKDMVFNHRDLSSFSHPEFEPAIRARSASGLSLCGPADDSSFRRSVEDAVKVNLDFNLVDLTGALRDRITDGGHVANRWRFTLTERHALLEFSSWTARLRRIDLPGMGTEK